MSTDIRRPVEDWAKQKSTPAWDFALAKGAERWSIGKQLTEAEYDAAIARATSIALK